MELQQSFEIKEGKLNKLQLGQAANLLLQSFYHDPLFSVIIHGKSEMRSFLMLTLKYYMKVGEVHIAYEKDQMAGVAIWNPLGTPVINNWRMVLNGQLIELLTFFWTTSRVTLTRLKREYMITESKHYKGLHNYLYMIGSVKQGAGSALMHYAINKYQDAPIYLENCSVIKNKGFYEKFGFHSIGRVSVLGVEVDLLKREIATLA